MIICKTSILLEVNCKEDVVKFNLEININDKLKDSYIVKEGKKLKHKIIVYNIKDDMENKSVEESINS